MKSRKIGRYGPVDQPLQLNSIGFILSYTTCNSNILRELDILTFIAQQNT